MKRVFIPIIFLFLTSCFLIPQPTLIPAETAAALTIEAMPPATDTPALPPTDTPIPQTPTFTPTSPTDFNTEIQGAYCIPTKTERKRVLVSRVIDGETIEVSIDNNPFRVKYIGLKAPGIAPDVDWQGPQAIAANSDLVSGKFVILVKDISDTDLEGNLLRYVVVDDIFVNYEMIRTGYARALILAPDVTCGTAFLGAQSEAQAAKLGVWSPTPLPTSTVTNTPTFTSIPKTPTRTLPPPCDCNRRYTCNNFNRQSAAQACYDYCGPSVGLTDKNNNGRVCESLP